LLKREATWEEVISEFKGGRKATVKRKKELLAKYNDLLSELMECKK